MSFDFPLTEPDLLARKLYETSPFNVSRTWDPNDAGHWDRLAPADRRYWYEKAYRQWLTPAPRQSWPRRALSAFLARLGFCCPDCGRRGGTHG